VRPYVLGRYVSLGKGAKMYSFKTLEIAGYHNEPVSNTFLRQDEAARQVAIVLPGVGYTCHMPLLYYPSQVLLALGMDVLWVEYNYIRRPDYRALSDAEQKQWLFTDVTAACQAALAQHSYQQVTLVGKSLGTVAMSHLLATDARFAQSRRVWLTPVLRNDEVRAQIRHSGPRALVAIGTADPYYDPTYLADLQAAVKSEVVVVDGADHSLEIVGNVQQSLQILQQVTRAIQAFVSKP
jgi:predicted alpha/beta-hydrolase family hydrolase